MSTLVTAGLTGGSVPRSGSRWFAVNTKPASERIAVANLVAQSYQTYLPLRPKTIRHARQFRTVLAPLFPGYLFVKLDPARDRWRSVNGTYGVVSLVTSGAEPLPVPEGIVEALLAMSTDQGVVCFDEQLMPGQPVKILVGPFAEQIGVLDRIDERGRVQVLLEMMGTHVPVVFKARQLVPA